jgi:metal-responsive CopG/Arc/MetJ family transcriptional regulator
MPDMQRVQLDMPEERVKELDELMREIGAATRKEFFNHAISLFKWAIEERKEGRIIASVDSAYKEYRVVVMPGLDIKMK